MRRIALVVAVLLAVALAYGLGRSQAPPVLRAAGDAPPAPAVARAEPAAHGASRDAAAASERIAASTTAPAIPMDEPLPPADTPIAELRPALEARARAGDTRAACRLAHELLRCARRVGSREMMRHGYVVVQGDAASIDAQARRENREEVVDRMCAGVVAEDFRPGFDWLVVAAERGNLPAMRTFAANLQVPLPYWIVEPERLALYRERAVRYAEASIARGDPTMLGPLASAYFEGERTAGYDMNPFDHFVGRDPERAYVYALLAERFHADIMKKYPPLRTVKPLHEQIREQLTPQQIAAGEQRAGELLATAFRDTPQATLPPLGYDETYPCED